MIKRFLVFTVLLGACLALFLYGYERYTRSATTYVLSVRMLVDPKAGILFDHESSPKRTNTVGFDDKARAPSAAGKRRILLVGDSFVSGEAFSRDARAKRRAVTIDKTFTNAPAATGRAA